jgi:hypothetical protein
MGMPPQPWLEMKKVLVAALELTPGAEKVLPRSPLRGAASAPGSGVCGRGPRAWREHAG